MHIKTSELEKLQLGIGNYSCKCPSKVAVHKIERNE
jgi:hypothetical protein